MKSHLQSDLDAMTRLYQLGLRYLQEKDLAPVLTEIVDMAIAFSGADFGSIQIFDPETSRLKLAVQRGFGKEWVDFWDRVAEGEGACGSALRVDERVIVEDVEKSPIFRGTPGLAVQLKAGVRAVQSTPLRSWSGKLIGMFSTHYKTPHRPDGQALRSLDLLAYLAASIVERSQIDQKEREMQRQVDLANQLVEFNHIVSHDLREPIRTAGTLLEIYLQRKQDPTLVESAHMAIRRTLALLNAISGYSRFDQGNEEVSKVDTAEIAHEVQQNLKTLIDEHQGQVSIGTLPVIQGRRNELVQLFQNLLMNALKYHKDGVPPRIVIGAARQGDSWLFSFADNGIGFDAEVAERIFAPFARFNTRHDGMGMGLAICRKIVARHGGKIWAESDPEMGSVFRFLVPE